MKNHKILDEKLVLRCLNGEKNAFTELVKKWHQRFCKQAFYYTKDKELAKDIAQESWAIIFKKLNTLNKPASFGSWALSIVNRKAIDALRKQQQINQKVKEYGEDTSNKNIVDINATTNTDSNAIVIKAISNLPENQQIVLRLFYVEEYSLSEISKTLRISKGTVKSRLFYAREQLKSLLKR